MLRAPLYLRDIVAKFVRTGSGAAMRASSIVPLCVSAFSCLAPGAAAAPADPEVLPFEASAPDRAWRAHNSRVTVAKDGAGGAVWRWEIPGAQEATLWVDEDAPFHDAMGGYQRFLYEIRFAEGQIDWLFPRAAGLLPPPDHVLPAEWNMFYFTSPHQTWISVQQVFRDPSWNPGSLNFPEGAVKDRARFLGFTCLPRTSTCAIELRRCRLVRDRIRVQRPYLTDPPGWPLPEADRDGGTRRRTAFFVKSVFDKPVRVTTAVRSRHEWFEVRAEPAEASLAPGQTARIDVVTALGAAARGRVPPMAEETAVVEFIPDGHDEAAYRAETFCAAPFPPGFRRQAVLSASEVADLRAAGAKAVDAAADFWMRVPLAGETDIPGYVGMRILGVPHVCPTCKKERFTLSSRWREVRCADRSCGHAEVGTPEADAQWVATWSSIHGAGPSPAALGRAYLATGDEKYARKAIELLTLLGRRYGRLPWHHGRHPQGSDYGEPPGAEAWANGASARWGFTPTYGTSFMTQGLAEMHDLVAESPSWTAEERRLVHEGFWVPVVVELTKIVPGISNMNDIINRDLVLAGCATGDAAMLYRGAYSHTGVTARLRDIAPDGFSAEGAALNYHFAGMREWLPALALLSNAGAPLGEARGRALAALHMPLRRAALNGIAYCTGNSGIAWHGVDPGHEAFDLAEKVFSPEEWPRKRGYSKEPALFPDAGWAVLRAGDTAETQIVVNLDYGRSHFHGDLDRMNLGLQAFGVPLSADPGSSYNFNSGAKDGPAAGSIDGPFVHNTVVVDAKNQLLGAGRLVSWQTGPRAQAVCAEVTGIYPGVTWRRAAVLVRGALVVVDDLRADEAHRYEAAWHHMGAFAAAEGCRFADLAAPLGSGLRRAEGGGASAITLRASADESAAQAGAYAKLLSPRAVEGAPVVVEWEREGVRLRLWQPAAPGRLAYDAVTGICWGDQVGAPVHGLYARQEGKTARFVAVFEPYRTDRVVKAVESSEDAGKTAVALTFTDGQAFRVVFDASAEGDAAVGVR